jgi:NAD(P)-dependent dehydrogenase (short-subunit alcohol dehydrogenase family)
LGGVPGSVHAEAAVVNRLEGKAAVVTGASTGLGRELAKLYAEEGARVVLCDIRRAEGERTLAEIRDAGGEALFVEADVSRSEDMRGVVAAAEESFGALHVMTANAGILGRGTGKSLVDVTEEEIAEIMDVNWLGVCLAFKHAIPAIRRAGGGAMTATASVAAHRGRPELPIYSASKGAVVALVCSLALDLAPEIRVNAVSIGSMRTEIRAHAAEAQGIAVDELTTGTARGTGFLGVADPRQVAYTHLHLVCGESAFITGQVIVADGGKSIATP